MKKKALIFGITGQDGAILSSILLKKNYAVHGICRKNKYLNLLKLNIKKKIKLYLLKNNNRSNIVKILNKDFNRFTF